MATIYLTEFENFATQGQSGGVNPALVQEPPTAEQTVSIGGVSAQSAAFNNNTRVVRLHTDTACSIAIGTSPTATQAMRRLAANQTEFIYFKAGQGLKLAVIAN